MDNRAEKKPNKTFDTFLDRIPARRLIKKVDDTEILVEEDCDTYISVEEIHYAFVGAAASRLIDAKWSTFQLRRDRVYLRTGKGLIVTKHRSLRELRELLDPHLLHQVHKSMLVNPKRISKSERRAKLKQVGISAADGIIEWLTVSRRYQTAIFRRLGHRQRRVRRNVNPRTRTDTEEGRGKSSWSGRNCPP